MATAHPSPSRIMSSAVLLAVGNVTSRFLGLLREVVKANLFGATGALGAYTLATFLPLRFFALIQTGLVNSALVPVLSEAAQCDETSEFLQALNALLSAGLVGGGGLLVAGWLGAPFLAQWLGAAQLGDPELLTLSVRLTAISAMSLLGLCLATVLTSVLQAARQFVWPAFMGAILNGSLVITAWVWPTQVESLMWGLVVGSGLQALLLAWGVRAAYPAWRWRWVGWHPATQRVLTLYTPTAAGVIITQLASVISTNLMARTGPASLTYLNYALTLNDFPLGLIGVALSTAILPALAAQAGAGGEFKHLLAWGVRLTCNLAVPAAVVVGVLAGPLVRLLFEHGAFTVQDTAQTAQAVQWFMVSMPLSALSLLLVSAAYALQDTFRPALIGAGLTVVSLGLTWWLLPAFGFYSVLIAEVVRLALHVTLMFGLLTRRVGGWSTVTWGVPLFRVAVCAALTGSGAYGVAQFLLALWPLPALWQEVLQVLLPSLGALLLYALSIFLLPLADLRALLRSYFSIGG